MAKVNLTINLEDEKIMDNITKQIIKSHVRKIVQEEIEKSVQELISKIVDVNVDHIVKAIKGDRWYGDKSLREAMRHKLMEKAAELSISTDGLKSSIDEFLEPVKKYLDQEIIKIKDKATKADEMIADEVKQRVDLLFKTTFTAALTEALLAQNKR